MKEINFVIAKGMPQAETTSADEEIETIARLVQENHQCADDVEVITVKPVLSGYPWEMASWPLNTGSNTYIRK